MELVFSPLTKTWIFDLDGTLVVHNGYKIHGKDILLAGVHELFSKIPDEDYVLILTARTEEFRESTIRFLQENGIRFNNILFNIPMGERVLINDNKPSGLQMAYAINKDRDSALDIQYSIDNNK